MPPFPQHTGGPQPEQGEQRTACWHAQAQKKDGESEVETAIKAKAPLDIFTGEQHVHLGTEEDWMSRAPTAIISPDWSASGSQGTHTRFMERRQRLDSLARPTEFMRVNSFTDAQELSRFKGRQRLDSSARPQEFTVAKGNHKMCVFNQEHFDDVSLHAHSINSAALKERLNTTVLEWGTLERLQNDFLMHDKLSSNELLTLQEKVDRAQFLHRNSKYAEAVSIYEEVLEHDPLNWECLSNLAKIHFADGKYAKSEALFERAVVCRPERDKTVYYLGHVLVKLNKLERAEAIFRQVSEKGKLPGSEVTADTYFDALSMRGLCLQYMEKQCEAQKIYDEVLAHQPNHVKTLCHICALKSTQGLCEAAHDHAKLVALDPAHSRRECPYLDSLFPKNSGILHELEDISVRWERAPKGKIGRKSLFHRISIKLASFLRSAKGTKC